jgi:hypothetical protein
VIRAWRAEVANVRTTIAEIRAALPPRAWVFGGLALAVVLGLLANIDPVLSWTAALLVATVATGLYADALKEARQEAETWRQAAAANAGAHAEALINEAAALEGCAAYRRRVEHLERVVALSVLTPEARELMAEGCQ